MRSDGGFRKPGQGGVADPQPRDLRAELLKAEAAHHAKKNGKPIPDDDDIVSTLTAPKRTLEDGPSEDADTDEDPEAKRRRQILEETREIDADSDGTSGSESDADSEEDDDDEEAGLQRELEKIKRERAEARAKEEAEKAAKEEEQREYDIARGNPLLNPKDFNVKRRWDDDVIFKNQARGTEERGKKREFVNDLLRSDFHKRFMSRYVR